MGIREDWRASKEIVDIERGDERSQHRRLLMWRDVLFTLVAAVLVYVVVVQLWPLSDPARLRAYAALPAVVFLGGLLAMMVSARWRRPYSPEFQRASRLRMLAWWPVAVVTGGAVGYLPHHRLADSVSIAVGLSIGGLVLAAVSLWRSHRSGRPHR